MLGAVPQTPAGLGPPRGALGSPDSCAPPGPASGAPARERAPALEPLALGQWRGAPARSPPDRGHPSRFQPASARCRWGASRAPNTRARRSGTPRSPPPRAGGPAAGAPTTPPHSDGVPSTPPPDRPGASHTRQARRSPHGTRGPGEAGATGHAVTKGPDRGTSLEAGLGHAPRLPWAARDGQPLGGWTLGAPLGVQSPLRRPQGSACEARPALGPSLSATGLVVEARDHRSLLRPPVAWTSGWLKMARELATCPPYGCRGTAFWGRHCQQAPQPGPTGRTRQRAISVFP